MISPDDPDPNRTSSVARPRGRQSVKTSINWTAGARREYSGSRAPLNLAAKNAARATLQYLLTHTAALNTLPSRPFALDLSFVSNQEICELNQTYRKKNKPTDVLSFSQLESTEAGEYFAAPNEEIMLGDLIIGIGVAVEQARELDHDIEREIAFLVIHGTLHLCGYDHDTSSRRRAMWKIQDTVFDSLSTSPCS